MNSNEEKQNPEMPHMHHGPHMHRRKFRRWMIPFFVLGALAVKSGIFFLVWNAVIPDLFHGPFLNFGQAVGLIVLAKLLFGFGGRGFGPRGFGHRGFGGPGFGHHGRHHWKHMSEEDREKLRAEFKMRFGR